MSVAVIVSTYGTDDWLALALNRALPSAQANRPQELIVKHASEGDACGVRNRAAEAARARWLCFLDADDELAPGYLEAMSAFYERKNLLLIPYVQTIDRRGIRSKAKIPNAGQWPNTNDAVTGTLIERKLFLRLGGFKQEFWPWPDWELWLRAVKAGAARLHVPKAVYVVYDRPGSENKLLTPEQGKALHARVKRLHGEVWNAPAHSHR